MRSFNLKQICVTSITVVLFHSLLQGCKRIPPVPVQLTLEQCDKETEEYSTILRNAGYQDFEIDIYMGCHDCPRDGAASRRVCAVDLIGKEVTSIEPLRGLQITGLFLQETMVSDFSPLEGQNIESIIIYGGAPVSDLSPLEGMPLGCLDLEETGVTDLSSVKHMPSLVQLNLSNTKVSDISVLENMQITLLDISGTGVSDLTPLKNVPLEMFIFTPDSIDKGIDIIRNKKTLRFLTARTRTRTLARNITPEEFWRRYDAGEFRVR